MVILTIQLLGWCWPGGIPFHYTLSVVSVPRVFGSGPFPPLGDMLKFERSQTTELLNQPLGRLSSISQIFGTPEPAIRRQHKHHKNEELYHKG